MTNKSRSPWVAFFFSWLVPGLGQLYNGQGRRAVAIYLTELSLGLLFVLTSHIWVRWGYTGFQVLCTLGWLIPLSVSLEATRTAWRAREPQPTKRYNRPAVYLAVVLGNWLLLPAFLILLLKPTLPSWGARPYWIPSSSMSPTLQVGARIIVDQHAYRSSPPKPMDLVIYHRPEEELTLVGRVVALGGDQVHVSDGKLLVNGQPLQPPWVEPPSEDYGPFEVPSGHVFLMGDNVNNSRDSRYAGSVPLENVNAKLRYIWSGPGEGTEFP